MARFSLTHSVFIGVMVAALTSAVIQRCCTARNWATWCRKIMNNQTIDHRRLIIRSAAIATVGIQTIAGELMPPVREIKIASEENERTIKLCAEKSSASESCAMPANKRKITNPIKQIAMSLGSTTKKHPTRKFKLLMPAIRSTNQRRTR